MYNLKEVSTATGYGVLVLRAMFLNGTIPGYIDTRGALYIDEKTLKQLKSQAKLRRVVKNVTGKDLLV